MSAPMDPKDQEEALSLDPFAVARLVDELAKTPLAAAIGADASPEELVDRLEQRATALLLRVQRRAEACEAAKRAREEKASAEVARMAEGLGLRVGDRRFLVGSFMPTMAGRAVERSVDALVACTVGGFDAPDVVRFDWAGRFFQDVRLEEAAGLPKVPDGFVDVDADPSVASDDQRAAHVLSIAAACGVGVDDVRMAPVGRYDPRSSIRVRVAGIDAMGAHVVLADGGGGALRLWPELVAGWPKVLE